MSANADTPFGRGIRLGRIAGVPIAAHWSLAVIGGLLTVLLATSELPTAHPGHAAAVYWGVAALTAVLFLVALVGHELAHAVVARRFGMRVGGMTLWMFGGLTELGGEPPSPRADGLIAAAGPLTSAAFAAAFWGCAWGVGSGTVLGSGFLWLALMSVLLAGFNLLPGAPLDGGRILRAAVWKATGDRSRASAAAAQAGRIVGQFLIVLGFLALLMLGDVGGLWLSLVGWVIVSGARSEQYAGRAEVLSGLVAEDVMDPVPMTCPQWWTAGTCLSSITAAHAGQAAFPVVSIDRVVVGAVTILDLERAVRSGRAERRVDELRPRSVAIPIVERRAPLPQVMLAVHLRGHAAVVVDTGKHPIGVIAEETIVRADHWARAGGATGTRPANTSPAS